MRIHGRDKLIRFSLRHASAKKVLDAWFREVEDANWTTPHDIKRRYPAVDFLADNRAIFNIKGNHYRLVAKVSYESSMVAVEWIGTHSEYDKRRFR